MLLQHSTFQTLKSSSNCMWGCDLYCALAPFFWRIPLFWTLQSLSAIGVRRRCFRRLFTTSLQMNIGGDNKMWNIPFDLLLQLMGILVLFGARVKDLDVVFPLDECCWTAVRFTFEVLHDCTLRAGVHKLQVPFLYYYFRGLGINEFITQFLVWQGPLIKRPLLDYIWFSPSTASV